MSDTKPKRAKAVEQALSHLRSKVIGGELMPGEQIRQQEMADEMGVSRVPLREALNLLADQGLLHHRPNQGYFVAKRAPNEHAQVRRMLQLLENELLDSIEWPSETQLRQLERLNAEMRKVVDQPDWTPLVRLNREFHRLMFSWSPYTVIYEEVMRLWTLADPFIATKMSLRDARHRTVEEHDRIIEALRLQDRTHCLHTMDEHRSSTAVGLPPELPIGHAMDLTRPKRKGVGAT